MKPPKFHIGQAVVCINGSGFGSDALAYPQRGRIYNVKSLSTYSGMNTIELAEIPPLKSMPCEWSEDRFEPVELASEEALAELKELLEPVTA